ncbi:MAG: hypothetical protein U5J98_11360 [Halobacteriales archaeon]|nr:hypothetical protein [Halobacteriales archaeon]
MTRSRPTIDQLAAVSVAVSVVGMLVGTALLLTAAYAAIGWLLFVLSFAGWLAAALLALRAGWHRGWFDR